MIDFKMFEGLSPMNRRTDKLILGIVALLATEKGYNDLANHSITEKTPKLMVTS